MLHKIFASYVISLQPRLLIWFFSSLPIGSSSPFSPLPSLSTRSPFLFPKWKNWKNPRWPLSGPQRPAVSLCAARTLSNQPFKKAKPLQPGQLFLEWFWTLFVLLWPCWPLYHHTIAQNRTDKLTLNIVVVSDCNYLILKLLLERIIQ